MQREETLLPSLLATGVVAVAFQPIRAWLQHQVNRLLFGQRNEPYAVITTLGQQIDSVHAPDRVLRAIVETIGQSLKLPYVAILSRDETEIQAVFALCARFTIHAADASAPTAVAVSTARAGSVARGTPSGQGTLE